MADTASSESKPAEEKLAANQYDPHKWLEDVLGEKPMDWVKERNEECIKALGDPKQTEDYRRILAILDSKDKIPAIHQIGSTETSNVSKVSPRKA